MTLAPRVEVFTQLACDAVYGPPSDYNHTNFNVDLSQPSFNSTIPFPRANVLANSPDEIMYPPSRKCLSDPAVQAGAARLQTIMMTTMGTLSAITTGWWGRFGERHGRLRVLAFSTIGMMLTYVPCCIIINGVS